MLHKILTMPYKAIKTDEGVKVVEIKGTPPDMEAYYCQDGNGSEFDVGAWEDAMEDFNSEPKQYPTLPTDKWELDRVYRDDEVRIGALYNWHPGGYMNNCIFCKEKFIGDKRQPACEPCCNIQYAVPNIQEDEDKVWEEAFEIMTGHYEAGMHGWLDEVKQKFNLTIKK